ncbi:cytochrome P450 [Streptomyces sp. ML-6]|uniref:cytochrome P450 n=1 Tax=Streptomyces sp. ML-6 TaxID=2982693 RepID=UPI0024BF214E|nr:cytochrome P450 [Streptomyces sp. ML-6]MDK0517990.1 cytochrome P450 [Streptomyces sp. ML-6]
MPGLGDGEVVHYGELGCWVVADPDAVRAALCERRLSSASLARCLDLYMSEAARARNGSLEEILTRWLVQLDGTDHAELRKQIGPALSPARVRALEPEVERIVDDALDQLEAAEERDAVALVSDVVPARVMGRLLTLPEVDVAMLYRWTRAISAFLDGVYRQDAAEEARRALGEMCDRLAAAGADRERPGGIWDHLGDEKYRLATASMMLFGGLETTASLLGSVLHHVVTVPGAAASVRAEGDSAAHAITEQVLRTHPPLSHVARVADSDLEIQGERVPAGGLVLLSLNGRDVIGEPHAPALGSRYTHAFGHGAHYCLGAALARTEAVVLLRRFCTRFPHAASEEARLARHENSTYLRLAGLRLVLGAAG